MGIAPGVLDEARLEAIRSAVMVWAEDVRRDLPWRRTRDPWAILVSEVMLQQTQVARVIPKWEAFLRSLPTVEACADAPQSTVVRLWEGLGYHRRAMNLHRAATKVMEEFGGTFPASLGELQRLPGIGPYTARALLAFAFEADAAVVDTNVGRILARAVTGEKCSSKEAQMVADVLVPAGDAWAWNQGVLDLGSMVCTKQQPRCLTCPLQMLCSWSRNGWTDPDPAIGSAGVSGLQSRFAGSDRQGRGRLLAALREGSVSAASLAAVMDWPDDPERAVRVAETLLLDGLACRSSDAYELN